MKFGVREICDVVLRAKATQMIGNKKFYKDEPVCYFDTLKTSTLESAVTTVYAQGGRGNSRLIAWDGEKTVTFTMEDALISPISFAILSGAGIVDATKNDPLMVHTTETIKANEATEGAVSNTTLTLKGKPADGETVYVFVMKNGEIVGEPYLFVGKGTNSITVKADDSYTFDETTLNKAEAFFVDYYTKVEEGCQQIEITADKFGGNYYLEANTLFRNQYGEDLPAEFIIPNCKVQSNFTFSMASSGDPSTFTFTMDAFPDVTKWNPEKKVLCAIQIMSDDSVAEVEERTATDHTYTV